MTFIQLIQDNKIQAVIVQAYEASRVNDDSKVYSCNKDGAKECRIDELILQLPKKK